MSARLTLPGNLWRALAQRITHTMGLRFARLTDLRRAFHRAVPEFGFDSDTECARWVLEQPTVSPAQQVLARYLTVGETYFFRDPAALEALQTQVLQPLIAERRAGTRHLRLWCAACCTGEEPYTLAILLHRLLPDLADWDITLVATDINDGFLRKAEAGTYGDWSFRDAPPWLRGGYFRTGADGRHTVLPHIRRMVRFAPLNLVADTPPASLGLGAMDVILCRNVLMYFDAPHIASVVDRMAQALMPGGCLLVGPGESVCVSHPQLAVEHHPGAVLYRRAARAAFRRAPAPAPAVTPDETAWASAQPARGRRPAPSRPRADEAAPRLASPPVAAPAGDWSRRARAFADEGKLQEALACCDRWLEAEPLAAEGHYVRAMVLLETGHPVSARHALRRTLYADAGFVAAYVALGHLEHGSGNTVLAARHFMNARQQLARRAPGDPVPGFEGLTAAQLAQTLARLPHSGGGAP